MKEFWFRMYRWAGREEQFIHLTFQANPHPIHCFFLEIHHAVVLFIEYIAERGIRAAHNRTDRRIQQREKRK